MRLPSAYCATSSGMAMTMRRVRIQPDWPSRLRTRLHSSWGTAGLPSLSLSVSGGGSSSSALGDFDSSTQLGGGGGGLGIGGGGYLGGLPGSFLDVFAFFGGGGSSGLRGISARGVSTCSRTS